MALWSVLLLCRTGLKDVNRLVNLVLSRGGLANLINLFVPVYLCIQVLGLLGTGLFYMWRAVRNELAKVMRI